MTDVPLTRRLALMGAAGAVAAGSETRADDRLDAASATAALMAFLHAFENCDLPAMEAAFAPDATNFDRFPSDVHDPAPYRRGPGMPPGMRALAEQLPKTRNGPPYHSVEPVDLLVQVMDSIALCTFHLESPGTLGRRTVVLRRSDAQWKIVHIHASNLVYS